MEFEIVANNKLYHLALQIWRGEYVISRSIAFIICRPTWREVIAAMFGDRVAQTYLMTRISPLFDKKLPDNVFSCRLGKGSLNAVLLFYDLVFEMSDRYTTDCYVGKFDYENFFMSINKLALYNEMAATIQNEYTGNDKELILYLLNKIILHDATENVKRKSPLSFWDNLPRRKSLFYQPWFLGLAIGNLHAQLTANYNNRPVMEFLNLLDIKCVNYVDDIVFVVKDKEQLLRKIPLIREFSASIGITLHHKKFSLQHYSKGCKFLGGVVKYQRLYVTNRTVSKCFSKIYYWNTQVGTTIRKRVKYAEKFAGTLNSYLGIMSHYSSFNIRQKIAKNVEDVWGDCIAFDKDLTKCILAPKAIRRERTIYAIRKRRKQNFYNYDYARAN
jgi:hypothetical protein